MKLLSIPLFLLLLSGNMFAGQQHEIDLLTNKLIEKSLTVTPDFNAVERDILNMNPDGSWSDIDYDIVSINYPAQVHLDRLINMTIAYCKQGNSYTGSEKLQKKIISGVDFFFNKRPESTNWWYQDIGAPQKYMVILILLKGKISSEQLHYYASYLEDRTLNLAHKGKNMTWVASITIYKGCIEDNFSLIEAGFNSIASTIKIVDYHEVEGIKIDYSIHQHRPQLYSGGYGMSFVSDLAEFIHLAHGTVFADLFTEEKMEIVCKVMLEGQLLLGYRESIDFGTVGRGISREGGTGNISPEVLDLMKIIDPVNAGLYKSWKDHLNGAPFPEKVNKYFWKSDIMTHHGDNYYLSAKVISIRTNGTEMLNGENRKAYYLPLGATNIMTTGNEYKDIFPVWDWSRVPGTTSVSRQDATTLAWYHFGSNKYAGGVSNKEAGCIAFEHIYNGVEAKKAYFFIGDAMLCLGSGINAYKTNTIVTTVNQCYAKGNVYVNIDGNTQQFTELSQTANNINWVHHDNVGYIFPEKSTLVINKKKQKGSWSLLRDNGSSEEIAHNVFSLWIEHGEEPMNDTYSYIVMPDKNLHDFEKNADKHGFVIVKNEPDVQAVKNVSHNIYAVVFYEPGSVQFNKDLEISTDKEAILLIREKENAYEISVADPLYKAIEINITFNKKLSGEDVLRKKSLSSIRFKLPQGEYKGHSVTKEYRF